MNYVFLPIDIDLKDFKFNQLDSSYVMTGWQPYWKTSMVSKDTIQENYLTNILDQLPFDKITRISYKVQKTKVLGHTDVHSDMNLEEGEWENIVNNEPAGYRIVISGKTDRLKVFDGKDWITAYLPKVPCCYLINSTDVRHMVLEDDNRELIYLRGFLNQEKHKMLLERSLRKYKDYAIFF